MIMKASVILAHPDSESFNHAIAVTVDQTLRDHGIPATLHDLYQEKFDPLLPAAEIEREAELPAGVKDHCREIGEADLIVIVHPNWWGQPPAILKGWMDRVIRPGVAYEFLDGDSGEGVPRGLLRAKLALVFNTSNTADEREQEVFGDPLETIWKNCVFGLCGVTEVRRKTFTIVVTSSAAQRQRWLAEVERMVNGAVEFLSER